MLVNAPPLTEYVNGLVPLVVAPIVMEPLGVLQPDAVVVVAKPVGLAFTTNAVVPVALVQPFAVTVTLYVPAIPAAALAIVGF